MVARYGLAFVAGAVAAALPLLVILFTAGVTETGEGNSSVTCWNFESQPVAQAFYDAVKRDSDPGYYAWLDIDADGLACEELPAS